VSEIKTVMIANKFKKSKVEELSFDNLLMTIDYSSGIERYKRLTGLSNKELSRALDIGENSLYKLMKNDLSLQIGVVNKACQILGLRLGFYSGVGADPAIKNIVAVADFDVCLILKNLRATFFCESEKHFSKRTGLSAGAVSKIMNGHEPKVSTLVSVASKIDGLCFGFVSVVHLQGVTKVANDQHPIDFFYGVVGNKLLKGSGSIVEECIDARCSGCQRHSSKWIIPEQGVKYDWYGLALDLCVSCASLLLGSSHNLGYERGNVAAALPALKGCSLLLTQNNGWLLMNNFIKRVEQAPDCPFELVELRPSARYRFLLDNLSPGEVFLYADFTQQKLELVPALQLSSSIREFRHCSAKGSKTIDLDVALETLKVKHSIKPSVWTAFKGYVLSLSRGRIGPADESMQTFFKEHNELLSLFRRFSKDPYARIDLLNAVENI
jgi:hypothetical protein